MDSKDAGEQLRFVTAANQITSQEKTRQRIALGALNSVLGASRLARRRRQFSLRGFQSRLLGRRGTTD